MYIVGCGTKRNKNVFKFQEAKKKHLVKELVRSKLELPICGEIAIAIESAY